MQHHQDQDFYSSDDEIDLFELFEKLWQEKFLIIGATLLVGIAATVVAFILPKTYSSEAIVNQAPQAQFVRLNTIAPLINQTTGIEKIITSDRVYDDYRLKITSPGTSRYAFEQSSLAQNAIKGSNSAPEQALTSAYRAFQQKLKISFDTNKQNSTKRITIRYESENPEETAHMINNVILPYTEKQVLAALEEDRRTLIEQEQEHIQLNIRNSELAFLTDNRLQLAELDEAMIQARAANIENLSASQVNPTVIGRAQYLLGTKLLSARRGVIKDRAEQYRYHSNSVPGDTGKPYIRGIAEKVELLNQLAAADTDFSSVKPVIIEKQAEVPVFPDKPSKKLIIVLGLVAGGMLGVFIALIRIAVRTRRGKKEQALQQGDKQSLLT